LVFMNCLIYSPIFCYCYNVRMAGLCHVIQPTTTISATNNPLSNCAHTVISHAHSSNVGES
jgi:hypothetical protein